MLTRNFVGGLAATTLGGIYLYYASMLRVSSLADSFGPRGMPLVYGGLMLGLGLVLMAQAIITHINLPADQRSRLREEWEGQRRKVAWAAGLVGLAMAYVLLVSFLGYFVSLALLIGAVAIYLGAPLGWRPLVISLAGATVLWLIFAVILDVSMPSGFLAALG